MPLSTKIRNFLYDPRVKDLDVDAADFLSVHTDVLLGKPILRDAFEYFYKKMSSLCDRHLTESGREIEIGSGAGFFKQLRPQVETSDIRQSDHFDLTIDAQNMALADDTVRCIYAINVFHHLPQPELFFTELVRVLKPGGGCILIEPHGGTASAALHKRLHKDEFFDPDQLEWHNYKINGPLSGANQALAHIIFERDFNHFKDLYGEHLDIVHQEYCTNGLRYLVSGGLNFHQLLPSLFSPILSGMELVLSPFSKHWSLHKITVIKKK